MYIPVKTLKTQPKGIKIQRNWHNVNFIVSLTTASGHSEDNGDNDSTVKLLSQIDLLQISSGSTY